jgi:dTDP-4-dehydrorhamnose 3,5-epimerase-like enzyme
MTLDQVVLINFDYIKDHRGFLGFWEDNPHFDFIVKRFYWIKDFPKNEIRGVHAHKKLRQILFPMNGAVQISLNDGVKSKLMTLDVEKKTGIFIPNGIWREITSLSDNTSLAILADQIYKSDDYIYSFEEFLQWKQNV